MIVISGVYKAYILGSVYYLIIFAIIILIPVIIDNPNISKFILSFGNNKIEILKKVEKVEKEFTEKTLKSNKPDEDKVKDTQKLIDDMFELGYKTGSERNINSICNVKVTRNQNGKIIGLQYDEN